MSTRYPLQLLLGAHARRLERALAQLAAAQHAERECAERLRLAQQRLDEAVLARNRLQWQRLRSFEVAQQLCSAELATPALRLGLLQDRIDACAKGREQAAQALAEAEQLLQQARERYRRAHAKREALLNHQAAWRRQRSAQQQRLEEAAAEDALAGRYARRSA